jgi:hypothetical protein
MAKQEPNQKAASCPLDDAAPLLPSSGRTQVSEPERKDRLAQALLILLNLEKEAGDAEGESD